MGGKGGNEGVQTVTQSADPWQAQQPYLRYQYGQAQALPQQQPYPFPGWVPFSPASVAAQEATTQRALQGSPLLPAAQQENLATVRGDYLYGGPGFNRAFEAAQRTISPMVRGQFERAGRFGGGLSQEAETRALGDAFAGLYGAERGRQLTATGMAPAMAQQDYADIARLAGVGAAQEAKAGEALADAMQRFGFQQQAPYTRLAAQVPAIAGGFPGGYQTTDTPLPQTSPLAGALGGGLTGLGAMQGIAGLTGGSVPAFAPLVGALGGPLGAAATWGLGGALLGGLGSK